MFRALILVLACAAAVIRAPAADATVLVAVFIGDSYTAGAGAPPGSRWTTLVSREMGWSERNFGRGGTGYATSTQSNSNYPGRIDEAVALHPDIVVISGGLNDLRTLARDPHVVEQAVNATFEQLRDRLPDARIVAVGPSTTAFVAPLTDALQLELYVRTAAASVGGEYISLLEPTSVICPKDVVADGTHVDADGHAAIAGRVVDTLNRGAQ